EEKAAALEAVAGRRPMLVSGVSGEGVPALLRAAWAEVKKTRGALGGDSEADQVSGWQP
ncbi:MAG: GTPase ObgE, partial [Pseudomonadota bacterium]|nr:GTPase ObgE [Pseudomonadota bacterium]